MRLTECERNFLIYYLHNFNAKWMRVFDNKHPLFETRVYLYTIFKRKLKNQPITGQKTYMSMFRQLVEGKWYSIPDLLNQDKEER